MIYWQQENNHLERKDNVSEQDEAYFEQENATQIPPLCIDKFLCIYCLHRDNIHVAHSKHMIRRGCPVNKRSIVQWFKDNRKCPPISKSE